MSNFKFTVANKKKRWGGALRVNLQRLAMRLAMEKYWARLSEEWSRMPKTGTAANNNVQDE